MEATMHAIVIATLSVGLFHGDALSDPLIAPADFQHWFSASCDGKLKIPPAAVKKAQSFRYVFVGGFHNEFMPGYFSQNIKELKSLGVSKRHIHEVYPSSKKTIAENRETFRNEFLAVAEEGPEKLVVIAHSRGACDALAFALENSEFTQKHIAFLFLVQGPFGGTPLVDYVLGNGKRPDGKIPWRYRVVGYISGKMEKVLWKRGVHAGLPGFSPDALQRFWDRVLVEHFDAIPIVGPKAFYITSKVDPSELGFLQGSTGRYLDAYHGPNDGIVTLSDQVLIDLGTDLGALDVGHADLTQRFPSSHAPRRYRRALIESILMAVGQTANPEVADGH
jgi:hypothetical protein